MSAGIIDMGAPDVAARSRRTARNGAGAVHPWRLGVIIVAAVVGIAGSLAMSIAIGTWQAHLADLRFTVLARDDLQTLNAGLRDATDLLYALRAYLESRDLDVSRGEYQRFSSTLRQRAAGLRDTGWAPRVTAAERDAFEHVIQAGGLPDFQIRERDAEGRLVRAGIRDEYFPILYSDPDAINRPVMGFDLGSEIMRRQAVAAADRTNRPAATPPVELMNTHRPNSGIMSFIPVRRRNETQLAGVVLGAFETATMIENILATKLNLTDLDVYVFNPAAPAGNRLIYWHAVDQRPVPTEESLTAGMHWRGTLELVDQKWGVIFVPTTAFDTAHWGGTAVIVLFVGLIVTISIVAYLWFSLLHTRQLESLTADLRRTTDELRRNGAALDHLARHDALTGLPNRRAFRDDIAAALQRTSPGQDIAVLYLDLDRFKAVNDTLGHLAGDMLLCLVASRLRDIAPNVDTIARLGGDEFAIAQSGVEQPCSAELLASRIIEQLGRPFDINGRQVVIGVSVGITIAACDDADPNQLLRRADMALYAGKNEGRGTFRFFSATMEHSVQARLGLEMDLRHALREGGLELYYQPQISVADGHVTGFEALLRWHHPTRGLVMPGDFIQCAEETGLIVPLGTWVLRTALSEAAHWPHDVRVAVNLSPFQLARDDLVAIVTDALLASGQPGARLELEITENALLERFAGAKDKLQELRAMGVRIAMDDFGTGYASLGHLRHFPFDRLKIDQSFVAGMTESAEGAAIIRTILQLAANLGIATTAEGVETPAQLELLAAGGCHEAQGFLFSPARPAADIPRLMARSPLVDHRLPRASAREG